MCRNGVKKCIGISAMCFGGGVLISFLLPGFIVAFTCAAAVLVAGFMLIR